MKRLSLVPAIAALGARAVSQPGIRPLRPLEIPLGPYQDVNTSAMTGGLMYEDGCLIFRDEETHAHWLPIWPTGTVFNGTSVIFHQPAKSDQRIVLGEEFQISGEQLQYGALHGVDYQPFKQQCVAPPFWVSAIRPAN